MRNDGAGRSRWSRRDFIHAGTASVAVVAGFGCRDPSRSSSFHGNAALSSTVTPPSSSLDPGSHTLGLNATRDGQLYIPSGYQHGTPTTLVLLLHGANGNGAGIASAFAAVSEATGAILLAPDSRLSTWDVIVRDFGPDVEFIDEALAWVFDRVNVDPGRLTIAGFSDGASYSLALGLSNGTVFRRVVAFSPGFLFVRTAVGKPPVFITHGENDPVLPVLSTSRTIVPVLEEAGYSVDYTEFEGGHEVDETLAEEAFAWAATP